MPGKPQDDTVHTFFVRTIGGQGPPLSILAPKTGVLGIAPPMVAKVIGQSSGDFAGIKVAMRVEVCNRQPSAFPMPGCSALILQALKEPVRDRKKVKNVLHDGSISWADVMRIASTLRSRENSPSLSATFAGTVREVLGTARSIGCQIEKQPPAYWSDLIREKQVSTEAQCAELAEE